MTTFRRRSAIGAAFASLALLATACSPTATDAATPGATDATKPATSEPAAPAENIELTITTFGTMGLDGLYKEYEQLHDYFGRGANDVMKRLKKLKREAHS